MNLSITIGQGFFVGNTKVIILNIRSSDEIVLSLEAPGTPSQQHTLQTAEVTEIMTDVLLLAKLAPDQQAVALSVIAPKSIPICREEDLQQLLAEIPVALRGRSYLKFASYISDEVMTPAKPSA